MKAVGAADSGMSKGCLAFLLVAAFFAITLVLGAVNGRGAEQRPYINAVYADRPVEPTRFSPNDIGRWTYLHNNYVRSITWTSWGGSEAIGAGAVSLLDGTSENYETPPGRISPVTVTLGGLRQCAGVSVYTTYTLQLAAGSKEPTHWPQGQSGTFACTPMVMSNFVAPSTPRAGRRSTACAYPLASPVSTSEEPNLVTAPFHPKPPWKGGTYLCYMRFHSWGGRTAFADGLVENLPNNKAARRNWPATIELSGRIWCPAATRGLKIAAAEPITYSTLKLTIYGPSRTPTPETLSSFDHRGLKGRVFWQRMNPTAKNCQLGYSIENPFPNPSPESSSATEPARVP